MPDLSLLLTPVKSIALAQRTPEPVTQRQPQRLRSSRVDRVASRPSYPQSFSPSNSRVNSRVKSLPNSTSNLLPRSGIQLYRQRLAALQSGQIHTRLPNHSFASTWRNATGQPSYEQWRTLLTNESQSIARRSSGPVAVMLGDSLSLWFPSDRLPQSSVWLNQGISGETTRGVLLRSTDLATAQPSTIYVMAGVNDLKRGLRDADILNNISQTLKQLRQRHPNAQIVLQSILPTRSTQVPNDRIAQINTWLSVVAKRQGAYYLDIHSHFTARDGYLRSDLTTDGIHLSDRGYAVWQSALNQSEVYLAQSRSNGPIAVR